MSRREKKKTNEEAMLFFNEKTKMMFTWFCSINVHLISFWFFEQHYSCIISVIHILPNNSAVLVLEC